MSNLPPPPPPGDGGQPPPPSGPPGQWSGPPPSGGAIPGGHPLADPWPRIGARIIDGIALVVVGLLLAAPFIEVDSTANSFSADVSGGYILISILLGVAYEVGFVGALGGTPGKLLLGLRVVSQDSGETPPGWDKAGLRYLPSLVGIVPFLGFIAQLAIVIASLVWLFSDDRRRTVYDRVASTYVVKI